MARQQARWSKEMTDRGATSAEYAILVSLIAIVILGSVFLLGGEVNALFLKSCDSVAHVNSASC